MTIQKIFMVIIVLLFTPHYCQSQDDVVDFNYYGNPHKGLFRTYYWSNDTTSSYYISHRCNCSYLFSIYSVFWKRDSQLKNGFREIFVNQQIKYCRLDSSISKHFILDNLGDPKILKENRFSYIFNQHEELENETKTNSQSKKDFLIFHFKGELLERIEIKYAEIE